jgi:hypothetical protein
MTFLPDGSLGTGTNFSGYRVYQDLNIARTLASSLAYSFFALMVASSVAKSSTFPSFPTVKRYL